MEKGRASNVDLIDELGVFGDELEAQFRLLAHQAVDQLRGFPGLDDVLVGMARRQGDAQQGAGLRAHGRFLQLPGRHLAQPLEAADVDLTLAGEVLFQQFVLVGVVAGIGRPGPLGDPVEGRHGKVKMPVFNKLPHFLKEECHQ